MAGGLKDEDHYEVDEKARNVILTDEGFIAAEQELGVDDLFDPKDPWLTMSLMRSRLKSFLLKT